VCPRRGPAIASLSHETDPGAHLADATVERTLAAIDALFAARPPSDHGRLGLDELQAIKAASVALRHCLRARMREIGVRLKEAEMPILLDKPQTHDRIVRDGLTLLTADAYAVARRLMADGRRRLHAPLLETWIAANQMALTALSGSGGRGFAINAAETVHWLRPRRAAKPPAAASLLEHSLDVLSLVYWRHRSSERDGTVQDELRAAQHDGTAVDDAPGTLLLVALLHESSQLRERLRTS
jgi:hypothetical protein